MPRHLMNELAWRQRTDEAGNPVLVLPRAYGILGMLAVLGGVAIPASVWWQHGAEEALGGPLLAPVFFTLPGLYLVLGAFVHRVTLTPSAVTHRNLLGRTKYLPWTQVQGARFSDTSLLLTLTDGRQRLQCHAHLIGFELLVQAVTDQLQQTPEELGFR